MQQLGSLVFKNLIKGGRNHAIKKWEFSGDFTSSGLYYTPIACSTIHEKHRSSIQDLFYRDNVIYSGGEDKYLIAWDIRNETQLFSKKFEDRISAILPIPNYNHELLVRYILFLFKCFRKCW